MIYQHTQSSPWSFRSAILALLLLTAAGSALAGDWISLAIVAAVAALVSVLAIVFGRLTVEVTESAVQASFGWGWPRRSQQWHEVTSVKVVRNRWWYGLGIRWFPGGTLWSVWGLDAVEFDLAQGRKLRIGTDEPEALKAAVLNRMGGEG